jgi:hypothetical protein
LYRFHDALVSSATAEVACDRFADSHFRKILPVLQQVASRHQKAWRAKPTLKTEMLPKGLLERMKLVVDGEALDGANLRPTSLDR